MRRERPGAVSGRLQLQRLRLQADGEVGIRRREPGMDQARFVAH